MVATDSSRNTVDINDSPFVRIVRIYQSNLRYISGTGLLFSDKYILTCSHVVTNLGNNGNPIYVDFPYTKDPEKLTAKKVWSNPQNGIQESVVNRQDTTRGIGIGEDVAILKIDEEDKISKEIKGFQLIEKTDINDGDTVRIQGYPEGQTQAIIVEGKIKSSLIDGKWMQINGTFGQVQVQKGYSGSPVWNQRLKTFIGITIAIFKPDQNNGQATISFMIPNSILKQSLESVDSVEEDYKSKLFKEPPSPPPPLPSDQYRDIIRQLRGSGLVVPFIGPRINFDFYRELQSQLINRVGKDILPNELCDLEENQRKRPLIEQLIGIPWPECSYLIDERPGECPHFGHGILGDGEQNCLCRVIDELQDGEQGLTELNKEQDLSVIKRNIRYLSLYYRISLMAFNRNDDEQVEIFYRHLAALLPEQGFNDNSNLAELLPKPDFNDNSNLARLANLLLEPDGNNNYFGSLFYHFLAIFSRYKMNDKVTNFPYRMNDKVTNLPFKLIITSNFDSQVTRVFDYYGVPYDLVFYVADGSQKGKFKHKSSNSEEIYLIDTEKYNKFKIGERPIILQLYGRWDENLINQPTDVFKNNFFVIDEMQFHGLLNNLENLPEQILLLIKNHHALFVGYNFNDYELQMIMQQLHIVIEDFKLDKSWLITHEQLGNSRELAKSIWDNFRTEIKPIPQTIKEFAKTLIGKMITH